MKRMSRLSALLALACLPATVRAATTTYLMIANPNWNITLSDYGYSDDLWDNTPGLVGREYLSGEWGAAVSYTVGTGPTARQVTPTWLQPNFIYPDWTTNSNFAVNTSILPTTIDPLGNVTAASSSIQNPDLRINISYQMLDTVSGMQIGTSPASAPAGATLASNRYVLKQTYTLTNIAGEDLFNINLFQFLHALNAQSSLYDNRAYSSPAGTFSDYRYDTTQVGTSDAVISSPDTNSTSTTTVTLKDYISFGSKIAPVAFDSGRYGINDGTDNHAVGKPSVGVHLAVEADALANNDSFANTTTPLWVSGAQKYALSNLPDGQSVSIDLLLSIRTGTAITSGSSVSGVANGGSSFVGGCDFTFENVTKPGSFFAEYDPVEASELPLHVAQGEFGMPDFTVPGTFQLFHFEYDGEFAGNVLLKVAYDAALLPPGFDETSLEMFHYKNGAWSEMAATVDPLTHTLTFETDSFSSFGVGAVPEPATLSLLAFSALPLLLRRRR